MFVYMPESVNAGFIVYDQTGANSVQVNLNTNSHLTDTQKSRFVKVYDTNGTRVTSNITTGRWYRVELLFADGLFLEDDSAMQRKNCYVLMNGTGSYFISGVKFIREVEDEEVTYKHITRTIQ